MSGNLKMTVNVSLCGSIPRSQMKFHSNKRLRELDSNSNMNTICPSGHNQQNTGSTSTNTTNLERCLPRQVSCETIITNQNVNAPAPPPIIDPPSWAVAAKGDSRLEPVCESINLQTPVDLTKQAVFRIGRSQNSDVQLLHCTSSRRHAILFHHPNGSCYVVDCGSAHGTYVNGVRVKTMMQSLGNAASSSTSSKSGIILPHRVKKGALIRFGGPGAPSFILKSFSVGLDTLMDNFEKVEKTKCDDEINKSLCTMKLESKSGTKKSSDALVALNTRLNALGRSDSTISLNDVSLSITTARLHSKLQPQSQTSNISFLKKRSVVSFDDENDIDREIQQDHPCKRMKMSAAADEKSSSGHFAELSDIPIVSPSRQKPTLYFDFKIERPVVSPTPIEDNDPLMIAGNSNFSEGTKSVIPHLALPSTKKRLRSRLRVSFSEEKPEIFYPSSITPESESD